MMFELIKPFLNFIWSFVNIPWHIGDLTISWFQVFSFSAVVGLMLKLIFGGKHANSQ